MTVQDKLVFKGPAVIIPAVLRAEMMAKCHATHIGIEGCIRRARESMYWPRMSSELKEYIVTYVLHIKVPHLRKQSGSMRSSLDHGRKLVQTCVTVTGEPCL